MNQVFLGDCLNVMRGMASGSVDLVLCSPPYEAARTYGIDFKLRGQEWVDWMVDRCEEMRRVCKGLCVVVCEGQTRNYRYSAAPVLLMADLHRKGFALRKPPIYHRVGIPGSGGPDWLRNDYEFCVCFTNGGKLPWSDNTAMGHPPKCPPGGQPSHHSRDGRVNRPRPQREGDVRRERTYSPPEKANPGNLIRCHGGGGHMGSKLAHENEAPYPETLCEFFIRSFCPPGGIVLDPFAGSGTTLAVAEKHGRQWIGIDCRENQVELSAKRIVEAKNDPSLQPTKASV